MGNICISTFLYMDKPLAEGGIDMISSIITIWSVVGIIMIFVLTVEDVLPATNRHKDAKCMFWGGPAVWIWWVLRGFYRSIEQWIREG